MVKVLVVEDEASIREMIALNLRLAGMEAVEADSAEAALPLLEQRPGCDAAILDVMLPGMNGFSLCETIRRTDQKIGIIILSAKGQEQDKIRGLSIGADDYMTKPFSARELLLRISAILKRCSTLASEEAEVLRSGGLVLDLTARRVEVDGRQINLTPREFDLLTVLMSHPDVAFSRKRLLDIIWGGELSTDTRTLDTHIQHIRCAIVPYSDRIVTLRGVGYRFEKE